MTIQYGDITLSWLGHAGFHLVGKEVNVYIDPFQINPKTKAAADYLLITHSHYDHLSVPDIEPLITPNTIIICPKDCEPKLAKFRAKAITVVEAGDVFADERIKVEAVSAYNNDKPFHPKANGWVGYVVTLEKVAVYHTGDSDLIPEMKKVNCNIALLPVSGTYVMSADEAAKAANLIEPELAIPMHWGSLIGAHTDAETFKKQCKPKVLVLEKEP